MSSQTDYSIYDVQNSSFVISIRVIMVLLGLSALVYSNVQSIISGTPLIGADKYFTDQSNAFVVAWVLLALFWRNQPENLQKICGRLRGAVTLYITITFLVYGIVLAPMSHPTGFDVYINLIVHYINPVLFIADFLYTERKNYDWNSIVPWLIYPHLYLAFSFVYGTITHGDYIYFFLNYPDLGFFGYLKWYLILISLFLIISVIYISYNKYMKDKLFVPS